MSCRRIPKERAKTFDRKPPNTSYSACFGPGSSGLFGLILLWWRFGRDSDWGIGGESVGMIVGVVTAVIAIFTVVQH